MTTTSLLTFAFTAWPPASTRIIKHVCSTSSPREFGASSLRPRALCRASQWCGALTMTPAIALPLVTVAAAFVKVVAASVTVVVVAAFVTVVAAFVTVVAAHFSRTLTVDAAATTRARCLIGPVHGAAAVS